MFHSRLLIDTGDGQEPEYYDNLSKALKNAGVEISSVILTHWHHDHVGGILGVVERLGLEVRFASKIDAFPLIWYEIKGIDAARERYKLQSYKSSYVKGDSSHQVSQLLGWIYMV